MKTASKQTVIKVEDGNVLTPKGFSATGIHTKVKRKRNDLGILYCDVPADAAAVYTLNQIIAAPLVVTKQSIAKEGKLQAIIVNSGNANACMGKQGLLDAETMRDLVSQKFSLENHHVAVASTGVIGEKMPMDKIIPGIESLIPEKSVNGANSFNEAILTTDTCTKSTCYTSNINGKKVTMGGSAKGSGMIAPNMATMLGFVTTDAAIPHEHLQTALREVTNKTFNRITVDGDTSTNDMVVVMASGLAENEPLTPDHDEWDTFIQLLQRVCEDLAIMIAKDGEGATKLIEVQVKGALNDQEAGMVAKTVVGSNLVKTMIYGSDPNWGRVMGAIGRSGATLNPETIDIFIGSYSLLENSEPTGYSEETLKQYLNNDKVDIFIDLKIGNGEGKAWGCDLTYEYVRINASYRT